MQQFHLSLMALAVSLAFSSSLAFAEDVQPLVTVVVTASKLKPAETAGKSTTADTATLLSNQPGVSFYGAGGASSLPAIHGLADDRLRIKVDGMDFLSSCPNHMNPPLSYLDPEQVDSLKVYSGIAPVSISGDSIGGSVVIKSNRPKFATTNVLETSGELGLSAQSNNNAQAITAQVRLASENFSLIYSGGERKADNYKASGDFKNYSATGRTGQSLARDEVGSTAYKVQNHGLNAAWKIGEHLFEAQLGYQDVPYQNYPNQRMDMLENRQNRAMLRYSGDYAWGKLEAQLWQEKVTHFMNFGDDKQYWYGDAPGMPMYTEGKTSAATVKAEIPLTAKDTLKVGTEILRYTLNDWWPPSGTGGMNPNTFQNINNGQRDRNALFAEWESRLTTSWQTIAGLRFEQVKTSADTVHGYDNTNSVGMGMMSMVTNQLKDSTAFNASNRSQTDGNFDTSLIARYQADARNDIEFGYARKVRSPNLYERYRWSTWGMAAIMNNTVGDGNGYVGVVNLKPEKADTLSVTWDWHSTDRSSQFKATPYYTRVADYIDAIKTSSWTANQFNVLQYANQSAELYGLDLSGQVPVANSALGDFGLKGLLGYLHGKNLDTGDDLYNIMPLNAKLSLTHELGGWSNAIEWVVVAAKKNVSDIRNELPTAGYGLINLHASYAWPKVRLNLGVDNLFDRYYAQPLGGAYLGQGSTMAANSTTYNWRIPVPGQGRTFYIGAKMQF